MDAERAHTVPCDVACGVSHLGDARFILRNEQVPAPVQPEDIVRLVRQILEQVDAAGNEAQHRVVGAGPPVAVTLSALVARERECVALVDQRDGRAALSCGEVIRGSESGNAGAADDDVGAFGHDSCAWVAPDGPAGYQSTSWRNKTSGRAYYYLRARRRDERARIRCYGNDRRWCSPRMPGERACNVGPGVDALAALAHASEAARTAAHRLSRLQRHFFGAR